MIYTGLWPQATEKLVLAVRYSISHYITGSTSSFRTVNRYITMSWLSFWICASLGTSCFAVFVPVSSAPTGYKHYLNTRLMLREIEHADEIKLHPRLEGRASASMWYPRSQSVLLTHRGVRKPSKVAGDSAPEYFPIAVSRRLNVKADSKDQPEPVSAFPQEGRSTSTSYQETHTDDMFTISIPKRFLLLKPFRPSLAHTFSHSGSTESGYLSQLRFKPFGFLMNLFRRPWRRSISREQTPRSSSSTIGSFAKRQSREDSQAGSGEPGYTYQYQVSSGEAGAKFGAEESNAGENTQGSYFVDLPNNTRQKVQYYVRGPSGFVASVDNAPIE